MESGRCDDLWMAAGEGRLPDVQNLLHAGADINQAFLEGMTSLHFATLQGNMDIVRYLVECGADVNKGSDSGLTPLMSACSQGLFDLAKFLIQNGASVNAVRNNLDSPLLYLCKTRAKQEAPRTCSSSMHGFYKICNSEDICGCQDLVKLLVGAGADINHADCEGLTALMGYILSRHFELAKFLIRSGANTNLVNKDGLTALLLASRFKYTLDLVEMLVSAGADVNHAKSPEGTTPLMAACYSGVDNVDALIRAGASVNAVNTKGETALKCAVFSTHLSVIESLVKAGVRIDKELTLAVVIGHGESLQTLIINGALPKTTGSMLSLKEDLEYLSRRFRVFPSTFLTHSLHAHLETLDITSLTPFMVALMRRDTAVARFLIQNVFFHPSDIILLRDFRKRGLTLENVGLNQCFTTLISEPWSLFNLSFLCISFAVGFGSDREKRVSLTGLPYPLQMKLLYRSRMAFVPVQEWTNLEPRL